DAPRALRALFGCEEVIRFPGNEAPAVALRGCLHRALFSRLPDCRSRIPCYTAASRLPALVRRSELQETQMPDQNTPSSGFQFGLANLKPAEPLEKITLTFPDGAKREYAKDITGLDIAR